MRRPALIAILALTAATIVGCGTTSPIAGPAATLQSGTVEANASATIKRRIIAALQDRYHSVTLEWVSDYASAGVYKFTARIDGRMVDGTYDSYSHELRIDNPSSGGSVTAIKRSIITELQRLHPSATVALDYIEDRPYNGVYQFSARINGRTVSGTYDRYSGRVQFTGGGSYEPSSPREGLNRKLRELYPNARIEIMELDKSSYGSYDFYVVIDSRKVFGNYDPKSDRITFANK